MMEATWAALEDAGRDPLTDTLRTAVFASASESRYLTRILAGGDVGPETLESLIVGTGRDFMATRIAYRLGLEGPAVSVATACSSSLVAVHMAVQSLNNGDCDQAVVVAASVGFPQAGSMHVRGGIVSPEGRCRPFDAGADGTIGGSGVIAMVLRRFDEVRADVPSYGVILGSAVNNDGSAKAGFNAPSPRGQAAVIRAALQAADVPAGSLGYLEAHGTGTYVGDPIEWASTSAALREAGAKPGQVAVGAVKANIGHLDAAAGLAGLYKALLVLGHGEVPAMAGFARLNPLLSDDSPLYVPDGPGGWPGPTPRRAAVSSFGIGGTNAHLIVEEPSTAQPPVVAPAASRPVIVTLSAIRPAALDAAAQRLAAHLADQPADLAHVAYSLRVGRATLPERMAVVGERREEIVAALHGGPGRSRGRAATSGTRPVVLLLPGQGAQRPGMARPLAEHLPAFAAALDEVLDVLPAEVADPVRRMVHDPEQPAENLRQTGLAQPALFAVEYAAARALADLGVQPVALAGHSLGEVTAAALAGVLDLRAAATLVVLRARAMQECVPGAMLAVTGDPADATRWMSDDPRLALAAVNASDSYVLSGPAEAVDDLAHRLAGVVPTRRLRTSHAFHSPAMEPAAATLRSHLDGGARGRVRLPLVANAEGTLLPVGAEVPLTMFADSVCATVRFADGLRAVRDRFPDAVAVEVGPGRALSGPAARAGFDAVPLSGAGEPDGPLRALAQLWAFGATVDLSAATRNDRRVRLPGTVFGGGRHVAPEANRSPSGVADGSRPEAEPTPGDSGHPPQPPSGPWDEVTVAWQELLGQVDVRPEADFYALGGDSLTAIRLARRLEQRFGVEMPLRELMLARTLDQQARLVARVASRSETEED